MGGVVNERSLREIMNYRFVSYLLLARLWLGFALGNCISNFDGLNKEKTRQVSYLF